MKGWIYICADLQTGMCYCGQDIEKPFGRVRKHLNPSAKNKNAWFHTILHSRPDTFAWMIVDECEGQDELDKMERWWGEFFDCLAPRGYNHTIGRKGGKQSEERRKQSGSTMKGKKHSPETIAKMAEKRRLYWEQRRA